MKDALGMAFTLVVGITAMGAVLGLLIGFLLFLGWAGGVGLGFVVQGFCWASGVCS